MNINQVVEEHYKEHGDKVVFKKLEHSTYDMQRGGLVKYAYGRLKDWMLAEDAVQDAYLHLLTYPPRSDYSFGALFKITLDRAISSIKKIEMKKGAVIVENKETEEEPLVERTESEDLSPDKILAITELTALVMELSGRLSPKDKAIVRLALIFDYSYTEIMYFTKSDFRKVNNVLYSFRKKVKSNPRYENMDI